MWARTEMPTVHDWQEGDELTPQQEQQLSCAHAWVPNTGRGGEPQFRANRMMGPRPTMHVQCSRCGARTWFTETQWQLLHVSATEGTK